MHYNKIPTDEYKYFAGVSLHMKFLTMVFGLIDVFYTECKYKSICSAYQNNSHTCTHEINKSYCGIYKRFLQEI